MFCAKRKLTTSFHVPTLWMNVAQTHTHRHAELFFGVIVSWRCSLAHTSLPSSLPHSWIRSEVFAVVKQSLTLTVITKNSTETKANSRNTWTVVHFIIVLLCLLLNSSRDRKTKKICFSCKQDEGRERTSNYKIVKVVCLWGGRQSHMIWDRRSRRRNC